MRCRHCGRPIPDDAPHAPYCRPSHRRADERIDPVARVASAQARIRTMTPERQAAEVARIEAAYPGAPDEDEEDTPEPNPRGVGSPELRRMLRRLARGIAKN